MRFLRSVLVCCCLIAPLLFAQSTRKSSTPPAAATLDPGTVANSVYRNKALAFSCKIPGGWVLRTDELNSRNEADTEEKPKSTDPTPGNPTPASSAGSKVLLAAFSRPPEAHAEDVNSSILIAAEPQDTYPGLKDAAQYFGPLTEVAQAQGFTVDEEPYEIALPNKTLVRADYHKDVGSRVMHQSTLAMLLHSYAISITVIAGTEDEVEEIIDGMAFTAPAKAK